MKPVKKAVKKILNKLPYIKELAKELEMYKSRSYVPPGHFYSPVFSLEEVQKRENQLWSRKELAGIDLNVKSQTDLLEKFVAYYGELPFKSAPDPALRYYYDNKYFSHSDAVFLYSMIRHCKPKRIIEVGCGFSSALMLDVNQLFFDGGIDLTFVEPFPENRLNKLVKSTDRFRLEKQFLQDLDTGIFAQLQPNDILFIDSSHVVKTGGELNYLIFEILPIVRPGVRIHFHDVFYPFEYPKAWLLERRSWNEDYFLRAFLMYNPAFEIVAFNAFLTETRRNWFESNMPLCLESMSSSLWIAKR